MKTGKIALEHFSPIGEINKKRLLFIHSSSHGSWMWKHFLSYFAQRHYDSWAINLRGHYLSEPVEDWSEVGAQDYLEDIDLAVKKISDNIVLIGHSMSGLLILKYAETHALSGLIVSQSGPPVSILQKRGIESKKIMSKRVQRLVTDKAILPLQDKEMIKTILFDKNNVDDDTVLFVQKNMGEESLRAGQEIMRLTIDPLKISAPLYILGFDASKLGMQLPIDVSKVLAEEFNARSYIVIEPGGHDYMLEKNWEDFARQFEAWINF
ncbi:MAG: alpha/beta fold hydrolase [Pseudomonadota bacterium]